MDNECVAPGDKEDSTSYSSESDDDTCSHTPDKINPKVNIVFKSDDERIPNEDAIRAEFNADNSTNSSFDDATVHDAMKAKRSAGALLGAKLSSN